MSVNIEKALYQKYEECKQLRQKGANYSAIIGLAEIYDGLPYLNKFQQTKWMTRIRNVVLSLEEISSIEADIQSDLQSIVRILSIGSIWDEDEIILVILKRIDIDILLKFLDEEYGRKSEVTFDKIDELIEISVKSNQNKESYRRAIGQLKRNRIFPFETKWLE